MKYFANNTDYYDALKRISNYDSVEYLRRNSERAYRLPFDEALEIAYENIINEAKRATHGKRRPKAPKTPKAMEGK